MQRVPFAEAMKGIGAEEVNEAELDRLEFWADQLEQRNIQADPETVRADARTFRELERLVKALDTLETIASIVEISAEYVPSLQPTMSAIETNDKIMCRASPTNRDFWGNFGEVVKTAKENVSPLLKGWLMVGIQGKIRYLQPSGAPRNGN
jgi:nuclear pore complex protein Nup107